MIGVSQAGFWVPRGISFEHRFAAAVADGGVVDVSVGWVGQLSEEMRQLLQDGNRDEFDRRVQLVARRRRRSGPRSTSGGDPTASAPIRPTICTKRLPLIGSVTRWNTSPPLCSSPTPTTSSSSPGNRNSSTTWSGDPKYWFTSTRTRAPTGTANHWPGRFVIPGYSTGWTNTPLIRRKIRRRGERTRPTRRRRSVVADTHRGPTWVGPARSAWSRRRCERLELP